MNQRTFHKKDAKRIIGLVRAISAAMIAGLLMLSSRGAASETFKNSDLRNARTGYVIPDEGYCDQPYVVVTADGNWLCTMTTGPGKEGGTGQHVVATISDDCGRSWSDPVDIEPSDGPEASWAVPLAVPSGRVYAFYTYNGDRIHTLNDKKIRADMLGWYVYRYSDDCGRTWSDRRYRLPMRVTACDRNNNWNGEVHIFWGICRPIIANSDVFFSFTKLGRYMLKNGEGWLFHSNNILSENDPEKIHWELLPDGEHGIRAPKFGSVQEEHNIVALSNGSLHCTYRTARGFPCEAYSRDGGRSWTKPQAMKYKPGGRKIKNPRACPMTWRTDDGRYLLWFHNHGGHSFQGRNPVWISGGVEKNGKIRWSEPEILLYDPAPNTRMSYPSLIEDNGRYYVTETNKSIARCHKVDAKLLEGLWTQGSVSEIVREGLVFSADADELASGQKHLQQAIELSKTGGISVELWVRFNAVSPGQTVLRAGSEQCGLRMIAGDSKNLSIDLTNGDSSVSYSSDPATIHKGELHHVVTIVDHGPRIISFVVDGQLCDGKDARKQGWRRYDADITTATPAGMVAVGDEFDGRVEHLRLYDRPLRTSEAIASYNAGPKK